MKTKLIIASVVVLLFGLIVYFIMEDSNLKIKVIERGDGEVASIGDTVSVHYSGYLEDGTKFDSSLDRGAPFSFKLGEGSVIKGWEEGVKGMRVGEKRELIISPEMGYGDVAIGPIPANSVLIFQVELLNILD